jgi:putative membrane protein
MVTVTDHMANERTYLAWVRTGITVMALGFVVAKFGIIIRELVSTPSHVSAYLSSIIGIILVLAGGFMEIMAIRSFLKNKKSIESGSYQPNSQAVVISGILILLIVVVLIGYMVVTL